MDLKSTVFFALVVAGIAVFSSYVDRSENWVFDPATLKDVAKSGIQKAGPNASATAVVDAVIAEAKLRYPKYVTTANDWLFNNAGGAMGSMKILHASFSEYVIIFGTAVGTEGHTGRFFAEDYFTIVYGEQWAQKADSREREVYAPGDQHYLPRMVAKQYKMPEACWALEYARGNIASMMFFGLADTFSSTLDLVTLKDTVLGSFRNMALNALQGKI
jgi:C-8 sterol isomerase